MKYSSIAKSEFDKTIDDTIECYENIQKVLRKLKQLGLQCDIKNDEIKVLEDACKVLQNKTESLEDYIETVDKFYDINEIDMD